MKEIIRWHLTTPLTDNPRTLGEIKRDDNGEYVLYLEHKEQVEQLQARIKELESEKENACQEGKLSAVNRLMNSNPESAIDALYELTTTTRTGEEYEESWSAKKLLEYFNVEQSFQSKVTELEDYCENMYWNVLAIKDGLVTDILNCSDESLKKFIQSRINEIKAQGIEEGTNIRYTYCTDYTPERAIRAYRKAQQAHAKKLRTNHD